MQYEARLVSQVYTRDDRLHIWRASGNDRIEMVMYDGQWALVPEDETAPQGAGLALPRGAWDAIVREAVPFADAGALGEVRSALEVERGRVERLITHALDRP